MPLADSPHTVLKFIKVQFLGKWVRFSGVNQIIYTANAPNANELMVVTEYTTGAKATYVFRNIDEDVWLSINENMIQIPAICNESFPEDITRCGHNK